MVRAYYRLTKPGIVWSNTLMAAAGFCLAATHIGMFSVTALVGAVTGTALVIAAACVTNNYIDRSIDSKMKRTRGRALVTHDISVKAALSYACILLLAGFSLLIFLTNWLVVGLGAAAFFSYVVLYGVAKRKTPFGTLVGTLPGGLPPVAGYAAVTGTLDLAAVLLFLLLLSWQMAHFYAIAMRRRDEYKAAGLPVWAVVYGMEATKRQIIGFVVLYIAAGLALTVFGYTGIIFAVVIAILGGVWLVKGRGEANEMWAKRMFIFSLLVLLLTIAMIAIGGLLP
jgi:protoheme IX farnesyltransferase